MAIFEIVEGAPGQGKSLYTARTVVKILARNKRWYAKSGLKRVIWSNLKFSEAFEKEHEGPKYGNNHQEFELQYEKH